MSVQQHGACAVVDCDRPAWWCDGHHLTAWSEDGDTSVTEGVLICSRHHTLAHQPRFTLQRQGPGHVRLVRRQ